MSEKSNYDMLSTPVQKLKNVGEKKAALLKKLGITDIYSLLTYYPRDYVDYSNPVILDQCIPNENNVFRATIVAKRGTAILKSGLSISKIIACDLDCGTNITITLFNNKYTYDVIKMDTEYLFHGKVVQGLSGLEINTPSFHNSSQDFAVTPIYRLTAGIGNNTIIALIKQSIEMYSEYISEFLPSDIRTKFTLANQIYSINNIHFPTDTQALEHAKKRLVFNEMLVLQLGLLSLKAGNQNETSVTIENTQIEDFYQTLPFTLTHAQQRVIEDCIADIKTDKPMNRLIQGDVGSGKTMVGIALAYIMAKNGYQTIVMAPTEILASQHYNTFSGICSQLGLQCILLTGSLTAKEKREAYEKIASGEIPIIIGTHAVISEKVIYHKLGLVVTDEQHRFGVNQRAKLQLKGDKPHTLVMSATPIPRTLALIIYGDLDISIIDEMPKGRQKIETYCIDEKKRPRAFKFIQTAVEQGRQAYIVCPAIEDSPTGLISVEAYAKDVKKTFLGTYSIGVLHGKLKAAEKEQIMADFNQNKIQILIATTVVEVGVDVPNATMMLIENAERFGLSQLHQLRGRVGRGSEQSYCILISSVANEAQRLKVMCKTGDGFEIAQQDLKIRGPGDFFGSNQHGLPTMKIADMSNDIVVLEQTQRLAKEIMEDDSSLSTSKYLLIKQELERLFDRNEQYMLG